MKLKKIKKEDIFCIFKLLLALPIGYIIKFISAADIWMLSERENEARDNAYSLYKYIKDNRKDDKVYYVIRKNCKDYNKFNDKNDVISFGSFKHFILFASCKYNVSAHRGGGMTNERIWSKFKELKLIKNKSIFIQHGIIKDYLNWLTYEETKYDLFTCAAKQEYNYVNEKFGYPKENVKLVGLCRYDNLINYNVKNQILLMPTWRNWFREDIESLGIDRAKSKFILSKYFEKYNSIINDDELIQALKEEKVELIFYPHFNMKPFIDLFNCKSDLIKIVNKEDYDIQKLLKESKLLITDYSSVAFDFAYMNKPIIYYQFDYAEYREKQYSEGYYDYNRDGFGDVVLSEKEIIKNIIRIIKNNFELENKYMARGEKFFIDRDEQNCKRTYDAIKSIK